MNLPTPEEPVSHYDSTHISKYIKLPNMNQGATCTFSEKLNGDIATYKPSRRKKVLLSYCNDVERKEPRRQRMLEKLNARKKINNINK